MKKSRIKLIINKAIKEHYSDNGLTLTADKLRKRILSSIDEVYKEKHKIKQHEKK